MELTLIVPGFSRDLERHALWWQQFVQHSKAQASSYSCQQQLFHLFGYEAAESLPIASVTALGDGLAPGIYLRVDPLSLQVDAAQVSVVDNSQLHLTQEELSSLAKALNTYLQQEQLTVVMPHPRRWYVSLQQVPQIESYDPQVLIGKELAMHLPTGIDRGRWLRLFSELQMILYAMEVNQVRQKQNAATVDALWFWGAGKLKPKRSPVTFSGAWGEDVLLKGLCHLTDTPHEKQETEFIENLASYRHQRGHYLYYTAEFLHQGREKDYLAQLKYFENTYISPILTALQANDLQAVHVYLNDGMSYHLTTKRLQPSWWKKIFKKSD